ncbi:hypothetical protein SCG7086_CL_00060 [Chlamydiales bacterium SCGC AG-110-P3]|nr:hypothetical protein SCG7086_CL_00060 [Chlamydiales bacterium SCGC AG-110-P3]
MEASFLSKNRRGSFQGNTSGGREHSKMTLLCEGRRIVFGLLKACFRFFSSRLAGVPCWYLRILKRDSNAFFLPQVRSLDGLEPSHLFLYLEQLTGPKGRQQAGY